MREFDVTVDVSEFLRAIFHFSVRYLQSFREGIIGLYTEFFEETVKMFVHGSHIRARASFRCRSML